ncbi:MAG: hypothetical protein Fur005_18970 [Roseiflexaceae bacterium]
MGMDGVVQRFERGAHPLAGLHDTAKTDRQPKDRLPAIDDLAVAETVAAKQGGERDHPIPKGTRRKAGQRWRFLPGLTARTGNRMLLIFGAMDEALRQIPDLRPKHRRNVGQRFRKGGVTPGTVGGIEWDDGIDLILWHQRALVTTVTRLRTSFAPTRWSRRAGRGGWGIRRRRLRRVLAGLLEPRTEVGDLSPQLRDLGRQGVDHLDE